MALSSGTRLGTYLISSPLGAGGMGEVYRARDLRLGREVAIKVLPQAVTDSADRLARFEREARTVAGLNHPNIVTLYSVESEEGVRFLTMELVEGQSLDRVVPPGGLPAPRVLDLAIPIANALIAAHERGVVHRDLKPGNVMVTHDGWVKVLDFGLAKAATESGGDQNLDATVGMTAAAPISGVGQVLGTVPYMAPEQIRGETVDARSDLFAFGIMLYELATGRRPFTGATPADVSSAILRDTPVPVVSIRTDLPRDMHRIITRCLEKNPRDRFQTARDVSSELRYMQREMQSSSSITPAPPTPAPATPQPSSSHMAAPRTPAPGSSGSAASGAAAPSSSSGRAVPSIAVLPFVNRSRGDDDEYFSDGLADELLNVLTKIRGLRVAARASSFRFRGSNEDLAEIGAKLNVATLLDGSVRKAGNRVRISVQLVKADDRIQLWSETYDRSLDDIFAVQDDIAQSVVKELRTTLLGEAPDSDASDLAKAEVADAAKGHGENPEAHRLYLQGKYFLDRLSRADNLRGTEYLEKAVSLDPSHAGAWTHIARGYMNAGGYGWRPLEEAFAKARESVDRALAIAPNFAEAHVVLSQIQRFKEWDWSGAEASARRALQLAPGSADATRALGISESIAGRLTEAERLFLLAAERDPLDPAAYSALAQCYRHQERLPEAEAAFRKVIELAPQRISTHHLLAVVLALQGRDTEALAAAAGEPESFARLTCLAVAHHLAGRKEASDDALRELEAEHAKDSAYQIAAVYGVRGEIDAAFTWLNRAIDERDAGLILLTVEPTFKTLHGDPRWAAALGRMGLRPVERS